MFILYSNFLVKLVIFILKIITLANSLPFMILVCKFIIRLVDLALQLTHLITTLPFRMLISNIFIGLVISAFRLLLICRCIFIVGLASPTLQPNGSVKQQSETEMFVNILGFSQPSNN
jgi:hypothetical protein